MNDLEQFQQIFSRSGVEFSVATWDAKPILSVETGHKGVTGYSGFGVSFVFTPEGRLLEVQLGEG